MRKFILLFAAVSIAALTSTTVSASPEADAVLQTCQQQSQGAADQYTAVMNCLNEKLQYDTSGGGE
jgi:hypothetical protein